MTSTVRAAADTPAPPSPGALWTAMSLVYVIWGSTYLAIAVVVETMPALLAVALRFATATLLLGGFLAVRNGPRSLRVTAREAGGAALVGVLLLTCGMGTLSLAEKYVPTGVAALLVAIVPLWVVLLRVATGDRPKMLTWLGVAVGLIGLAVLVLPGGGGTSGGASIALWSVAIVAGSAAWALGSFLQPRLPTPRDPLVLTVYEMAGGCLGLLVVGLVSGERLDVAKVSTASWIAWAYLVLVGSLVGYVAYVWLLGRAPLSLVSTYAYVNPVVAVLLGVLFHGESLTPSLLIGGAVIVVGVVLVVSAERQGRASPPVGPAA